MGEDAHIWSTRNARFSLQVAQTLLGCSGQWSVVFLPPSLQSSANGVERSFSSRLTTPCPSQVAQTLLGCKLEEAKNSPPPPQLELVSTPVTSNVLPLPAHHRWHKRC